MRIFIFFFLASFISLAQNFDCGDPSAVNYNPNVSELVFETPLNTGINMTVGGDAIFGSTNLLIGDIVGAFFMDDSENYICAGLSSFNIEGVGIVMTIYGDDASSINQNGFYEGQPIYLFVKRSELVSDNIYPVSFSLLGEDENLPGTFVSLPTEFDVNQIALFDAFSVGGTPIYECLNFFNSGCTDSMACNYDALATISDESCVYPNTLCESCQDGLVVSNNDIIITYTTSSFEGYEVSCDSANDGFINIEVTGGSGNFSYLWSNGSASSDVNNLAFGNYILSVTDVGSGCVKYVEISLNSLGPCVVFGCTDSSACNYDSSVTDDDDSCYNNDLGCGCDLPAAVLGYDCSGNCLLDSDGDGVCDNFEVLGCIDLIACNYNTLATEDDFSCIYLDGICETCIGGIIVNNDFDGDGVCNLDEVEGCTDNSACNYNILATEDDFSCIYLDGICETCVGGLIIDNDLDGDGVCNLDEVEGCTNSSACNYDANLTTDNNDNLCLYSDEVCETCSGSSDGTGVIIDNDEDNDGVCNNDEVEGCVNNQALNYSELATDDDGSCVFCSSLNLIGNSNYLNVNDVHFANASGVTISFWIYDNNWQLPDNSPEGFGSFIDFGSTDNFRYVVRWRDGVKGIQAYFEGDGFQNYQGVDCDGLNSDNCYSQNTTSSTYIIPPYDFINNNSIYNWWENDECAWKNITAVFCSNSTRLYIDGQMVQQSNTNVYYPQPIFSLDSLDNKIIGSNQADSEFSEGQLPSDVQIDEVRIWSRALSSLEILERVGSNIDINLDIYSEQSNDVGKLEGYWKFDSLSIINHVTNISAIPNSELLPTHFSNQYCNYQCDNNSYNALCLDNSNSDCDACTPSEGCTDPNADNYDVTADIDNGICIYYGCMDNGNHIWSHIPGLEACNYNPNANINQFSMLEFQSPCIYPIDIYGNGALDCEGSCLYDCDSDGVCDWEQVNHCFDVDGNIVTNLNDDINNITGELMPDGIWDCLSVNSLNIIDNCMLDVIIDSINNITGQFYPDGIPDCLNSIDYSIYYNPLQTDIDLDGIGNSCDDSDGGQLGCMDINACNFDFWADIDNGMCQYCYLNDCGNFPSSYINDLGELTVGPYDCYGYCLDLDSDGLLDDADLDDICDLLDNCPNVWNPGQMDSDNDGLGDACQLIDISEFTSTFSVSPNPVNEYFVLSFLTNDIKIIKLFENTGRLIWKKSIISNKHLIHSENLAKGAYIIQVESQESVSNQLIIIE